MSLLNFIPNNALEDKEKLEEDFIAFLRELDYPEDAFFRGPSFNIKIHEEPTDPLQWLGQSLGNGSAGPVSCYADLAILELQTCQYLALVEFRLKLNEQTESELASVFQVVLNQVHTRPPAFLVVPVPSGGFRIYQLRENARWEEVPKKHFPHYTTLAAGFAAEKNLNREFTQSRNLDRFALMCRLLAGGIGILALLNIIGLSALTAGQISLLIFVAVLLIAPEAAASRGSSGKPKPKLLRIK